ncbi:MULTISPECIES: NmrA family NAD(P)-binding protein [Aliiglaciecola]|uniref:NmrA family NAD(P)-binding protein n=1 Tax=Aliiglaciecola TaxID=1406885 RepID=UPI001C0A0581|nr:MULTISPECIES: NmrA family NAD(P)-binding protein [Aliiglaciecola]MBU2878996.1 NmrA family NAD(P)-binding protein [Aliiglaciecola lipolytica]MDO6710694.1 NmrA family NAD(P)-binding protein [Aliiglaciecola sp. 2_MG-2023]MDO6751898.1 NmrA family NAD(P)-binding protein [Aliiglaciecola sp. 1_MG-2023]
MILIIGATGKTGSSAVKHLVEKGCSVRALIRNPDKASALTDVGVDVVVGDVADSVALQKAMHGVNKVFLLLPNSSDQLELEKQVVDAAVKVGVELFVKQSSQESVEGTDKPIPLNHLASEAYVKASGLNWVMIRPTFFTQMLLTCAPGIKAANKLTFPMGQGQVAATDARDVGEVVANVLTQSGHENKSYDLTGPELLTFSEIADIFTKLLGRQIDYVDQPMEDFHALLSKFVPDKWRVNAVCEEIRSLAEGASNHTTDTMRDLLGREPRSVKQFIQEYAKAFNPE